MILLKQLKEVLLSHKESIFEKALFYSNGDATLALEKIFHVTMWIAKKYKQLANKNRALELFYERLAIQSFKRSQQTIYYIHSLQPNLCKGESFYYLHLK